MTLTLMIILIPYIGYSKRMLDLTVRIIHFTKSDLDLDPMTLVLKLDLDMVKMYDHTKNEVSMSRHSKVIARTHRHIDSMKTLPSRICGR